MDVNNVVYSILGRAGVVFAPSNIQRIMNIVRINIIDIKSDRSILMRVNAGVHCSYTSWEAEQLSGRLMDELKELIRTL